jgi:hypothetical protein
MFGPRGPLATAMERPAPARSGPSLPAAVPQPAVPRAPLSALAALFACTLALVLAFSVDAADASPPLQPGQKIVATGEVGEAHFGTTATVSADGNTILVGGPRDNNFAGAVWVFVRSGASWVQQGEKLTDGKSGEGSEAAKCKDPAEATDSLVEGECSFGASIALSADGNTALIGSPLDNGGKGGAWVFTRSGSTWTRIGGELTGGEEAAEIHFGRSVALSADGSLALVGAPSDAGYHGTAWAFKRSGSEWVRDGPAIQGGETAYGYFGRGVALSADGRTALIGAPGDHGKVGAAWTFTHSGSAWTQGQKLTADDEAGPGRFGYSVALSSDATVALIGGYSDNGDAGAAWLYRRSGVTLTQQGAKLTGPGEVGGGQFGRSIALTGDGGTALIGAPRDETGQGAAWAFTGLPAGRDSEKFEGDGRPGKQRFGAGIGLSADGATPVFGEPLNGHRFGAAWVGWPPPVVASVVPGSGPAGGGTEVTITGAGFTEASAVHFGSTNATRFTVSSSTTIVATSPPGVAGSVVDVTVTTPLGTSEASVDDEFAYLAQLDPLFFQSVGSGGSLGVTATSPCRVSLVSRSIGVLSRGRALLRLRRIGAGRCAGKLTLKVASKRKGRRTRYRAIGSTRFAIATGRPVQVKVKLTAYGRSLLRARHGQLRAQLVLVRLTPAPPAARTAPVRLKLAAKKKTSASR